MSASIAVQVVFLVVAAGFGTAMLVMLARCHRALSEIRELRASVERLLNVPSHAESKKCPECAERIRAEAVVCPHCGHLYETQYQVVVKSQDSDLANQLARELFELTSRPVNEILDQVTTEGVGFTFKYEDLAKVSARGFQDRGYLTEIVEILV